MQLKEKSRFDGLILLDERSVSGYLIDLGLPFEIAFEKSSDLAIGVR